MQSMTTVNITLDRRAGVGQIGFIFPEHEGGREGMFPQEGDLDAVVFADGGIEDNLVIGHHVGLVGNEGLQTVTGIVVQEQRDVIPFRKFYVVAAARQGDDPESGKVRFALQLDGLPAIP